jgi:hypothetical protein
MCGSSRNPERLRRRQWASLVSLLLLAVVLGSAAVKQWRHTRSDAAITKDAERLAGQFLDHLGRSDSAFATRLGSFKSFSGVSFARPQYAGLIIPRLEVVCTAHFTRADVAVRIYVVAGPSQAVRRVDCWPKVGRGVSPWTVVPPNELVVDCWVTHPKFIRRF